MNSTKKILIVEDSTQIHMIYKLLLMRYKCEIVAALSGHEGLAKLAENPDISLMIIDIRMQLMSGLEFIKKVHESGKYSHIPIIIASNEGAEADTAAALALGAQACIRKPFTSSEWHALIENFILQGKEPLPYEQAS